MYGLYREGKNFREENSFPFALQRGIQRVSAFHSRVLYKIRTCLEFLTASVYISYILSIDALKPVFGRVKRILGIKSRILNLQSLRSCIYCLNIYSSKSLIDPVSTNSAKTVSRKKRLLMGFIVLGLFRNF